VARLACNCIQGVEVDGATVAAACAGDSVDVGLSGVQAHELHRGSVLCHPDFPIRAVCVLEARVVALDLRIPILSGAQVTFFHPLSSFATQTACIAPLCVPRGNCSRAYVD
jgi:translation elongation factor EF-1alpha